MTPTTHPSESAADGALDITSVPAHLFNTAGKWQYEVTLDYTGLDVDHWDLHALAHQALAAATANGTSGVTISTLGDCFTLVVVNPPGRFSHAIMVRSSGRAAHD